MKHAWALVSGRVIKVGLRRHEGRRRGPGAPGKRGPGVHGKGTSQKPVRTGAATHVLAWSSWPGKLPLEPRHGTARHGTAQHSTTWHDITSQVEYGLLVVGHRDHPHPPHLQ